MPWLEERLPSSGSMLQCSVVVPIRTQVFQDPDPDPLITLMSTTKLTGRENLTKCAFWLGPGGPTDRENQIKMYKKYCFMYITSLKR